MPNPRWRTRGSALLAAAALVVAIYVGTQIAQQMIVAPKKSLVDHLDVTIRKYESSFRVTNSTNVPDGDDVVFPMPNTNKSKTIAANNRSKLTIISAASTINNSSSTTQHNSTNTFFHVITFGTPRTATTLQFNTVCVSLFLHTLNVRPSLANHTLCNNGLKFFLHNASMPQVTKTHKTPTKKDLFNNTWLFTTAKNRKQANKKREQMKREYNPSRIGYVQDLETLSEVGIDGIIRDYADFFYLSPGQIDIMIEYFNIWDKLRICCGLQMSKYWRNELLPSNSTQKNINMKNHSLCPTLDIDATERQFMETRLYKLMDQYERMRYVNRPSLVDGILNGTYCSRYNDEVREKGVAFNRGGDEKYFIEGQHPLKTFGIAN